MARYYFDLRDGNEFISDDEGMEFHDMRAVRKEAARALAGLAGDSMRNFDGAQSHQMIIEVRDHLGTVMTVKFHFDIA
jgi:hypothetical protein